MKTVSVIEKLRNAQTHRTTMMAIAVVETAAISFLEIRMVALNGDEGLFKN